ncbi:hypothetical protein [Desulfatitalea alkaliphila]|uniref:Uncharacterized protein n=1 Tax=Desulfatitalea alkaliphila TaxID=2929485 RepID=A0AA41R0Y0_9BACT|nr:hypothetical protein [Desulfatitalea alkaliphila]MCJ8500284.1 hypothetical protein [Desulfatitalea alkaliphila]
MEQPFVEASGQQQGVVQLFERVGGDAGLQGGVQMAVRIQDGELFEVGG